MSAGAITEVQFETIAAAIQTNSTHQIDLSSATLALSGINGNLSALTGFAEAEGLDAITLGGSAALTITVARLYAMTDVDDTHGVTIAMESGDVLTLTGWSNGTGTSGTNSAAGTFTNTSAGSGDDAYTITVTGTVDTTNGIILN